MRYTKIRKALLRTLTVALVLLLPWGSALAKDVSDWAGITGAYNGWQSTEFTLTADVTADSVLDVPSWHAITIILNDHTLTPPEGKESAFSGEKAVTYVVDDEAEFLSAAADPGSRTIRLAGDITLTGPIVLKNAQTIDAGSWTLTMAPGAALSAEVATYDALKAAMNNPSITGIRLTGDITATESCTVDLARVDLNGYGITTRYGNQTVTMKVYNEAELRAALGMSNVKAQLQNNIALTSELVLTDVDAIDANGFGLTGRNVVAEVDSYQELKAALNSSIVTRVKLTGNITATENLTIEDLSRLDLDGHTITRANDWDKLEVHVGSLAELKQAIAMNPTAIVLKRSIEVNEEVEIDYSVLKNLDLNGKNLTVRRNGGLVVGVTEGSQIGDSLSRSYVKRVALQKDITLSTQVNVDDLSDIDENGHTLSFSGEGKVALNVGTEEELRQAIGDADVKYINLTGDIHLRRDLTITGANLPQVISNGYKITGARVSCSVNSWEALKAACSLGLPGMQITLSGDILQGEGTAVITADTTLEMNFNHITTAEQTLFDVRGGTLTVKASQPANHQFVDRNPVEDPDAEPFCKPAYISNDRWGTKYFNYFITKSDVVASGSYANAGTRETRWHYSVNLDEVGFVDASKAEEAVFNVGSDGKLDIQGGIYYNSGNRAIYANGDVNLSYDVVFANNSAYDGGAVYMNKGTLTINPHRQGTDWHGVVFTGNRAWAGSSGGAIYINHDAVLNMEEGYITNNWCDEILTDGGWSGGGGVAVLGKMILSGGWITANQAIGGGGIKTLFNGSWDDGGDLRMTGGIVAGNFASRYEGGGIVINHSGYGKITGGYITNNRTDTHHHWGGGGIFISDYGYLDMESVFIVHNEAGGYGGGLAGCSTGRIDTHDSSQNIAHGVALFENTAAGTQLSGTESTKDVDRLYAANDPVFKRDNGAHYQDYFCALSSYICGGMLGNHSARWSGTVDGEAIAEGSIGINEKLVGVSITGLTSHPQARHKTEALRVAKVFVTGNSSYTHGGGILCNGYLVIGKQGNATIGDRMSIAGRKETEGFSQEAGMFTFRLVEDTNRNGVPDKNEIDASIVTGTNDASGNVEFSHRLPFDDDGEFVFLIYEEEGDEADVTYDKTIYRLTVTVTLKEIQVVDTPDGNKHDEIAEPKWVDFYSITAVKMEKKEAGSDAFVQQGDVLYPNSTANGSLDLTDMFTFLNTKEVQEYVDVTVTKKWVDNANQDGLRPAEITVQLLADGNAVEGQTAILTGEGDEWTHTFIDLPKKANGVDIVYTVAEVGEVVGYTTAYSDDTLTITNTHETDKTQVTVTKKWVDNANQDGLRPAEITVQLLADGVAVDTAILTGEGDEWTHTFTDLPKKANGVDIVYMVAEVGEVVGYTTAYSDDTLTITNTHETENTQITVTKKWVDNANQDGLRPAEITVQLLADGVAVEGQAAVLTGEGDEWTHTFTDLPKKANGVDIVYTVAEVGEVVGYTTAYSNDTLTITNTHETDKTQVTVTKKWVDNANQDGLRPAEITVQLLADGVAVEGQTAVLTGEGDEWTHTFTDLPKKANGIDIVYTVAEVGEVIGYTTAYSDDTLTITNTHETENTQITVTKKWVDNANQDGLRPAEITVQLLADGVAVEGQAAVLTGEGDEWTHTFTDLPKKANGVDIVYTVEEIGEVVGYTTAYSDDTLTITNTHETDKTQITVTKKWVDNANQDGLRPAEITVQLLADGVAVDTAILTGEGDEWTHTFTDLPKKSGGVDIVYTVAEVGEVVGYTTAYSDDTLTITNTHDTENTQITVTKKWVDNANQDGLRPVEITVQLLADGVAVEGQAAVLTGEGDEWTHTFTDLPKKANGIDIVYTVAEVGEVVGYTTAYSDDTLTITNTHETDKTQITVTKKWVDNANQDGLRPAEITVQLLADGVAVEGQAAVLTGEGDEWTHTFIDLPKKANGVDIVYTVAEVGEVVGYTTAYSDDTLTITNTHETDKTQVTVTKKWVDNANQDGLRPAEITVQLLADGVAVEGQTAILTGEGDEWTHTFTDLPKKANGVDIVYTVEEIGEVVGYTTAYSDDTLTITNTHDTENTQITVTKKWVDNANQDGLRPAEITVQLLADGNAVEGQIAILTGEGDEWTHTFIDLPKKANGVDIVYTVAEVGEVVGYTTAYSDDTLTITNTHETENTQITVTKKWVDNANQDGLRPAEITVQLLADGVAVEGQTAILTGEGDEWTHTFTDLPKKANGVDIVYTVAEVGEVVGYTTAYSDDTLTITNTHETETVSLTVEKVWEDSNNIAGKRAASITVQLLADGVPVEGQTITLNKDNGWKGGWNSLDKNAAGTKIAYSVAEVTVPEGYASRVEMTEAVPGHFQVKITNTYAVQTTQISVTKKWVDGNNYDGLRPRSITVQLLADGVPVEGMTAVMTGSGNEWMLTFTDLPMYAEGAEGKLIHYTVEELGAVVGYTTAYSDDTLTITNTHELYERYTIAVEKTDAINPDKVIAGAKFAVYSDAECTQLVDVITTDAQGKAQLGNLLAGTYYLVETAAPAGYQLDASIHAVEAGENTGKVVTVELVNYPLIGSLTLEKTVVGDASGLSFTFEVDLAIDTGDKLEGAYNATLNGVATTVTFTRTDSGAEASVTLKDGDTLTILGLRSGTKYTVTEQPGEFFTTTVNGVEGNTATGEISQSGVSVAAFENKLQLTDFSVKKEWRGLDEGEVTPDITLILYCNGEVYSTVTPVPTVGGWYIYEDLPVMVNGVKAVYTVKEQPMDGFTTTYTNGGDNEAEVDCVHDGGVIVNSRIPHTGDDAPVMLWMLMMLLSAAALVFVRLQTRRNEL